MQLHKLTIECDDARSQLGQLDPADASEMAAGALLLLAANAHFYTEGRVPRDRPPGTAYFSIGGGSPREEPWTYEAWVRVIGSEVYDVARYSFSDQVLGSVQAWERSILFRPPEFARVQTALPGSLYSSIWEREPPIRTQILRLSQRTAQAMHMIGQPAGRAACQLHLTLDGALIMCLGHGSLEQELMDYSRKLRARGQIATG